MCVGYVVDMGRISKKKGKVQWDLKERKMKGACYVCWLDDEVDGGKW